VSVTGECGGDTGAGDRRLRWRHRCGWAVAVRLEETARGCGSTPAGARRGALRAVGPSLVRRFERQAAGTPAPDGRDLSGRSRSRVRIAAAPEADLAGRVTAGIPIVIRHD
jgi:hypothetical protein